MDDAVVHDLKEEILYLRSLLDAGVTLRRYLQTMTIGGVSPLVFEE